MLRHPEWFSLKIGITALSSTKDRLAVHERSGWELVRTWEFDTAFEAEDIEQRVVRWWRDVLGAPPSVLRDQMPQGGWTETVSLLYVEVDEVVDIIGLAAGTEIIE